MEEQIFRAGGLKHRRLITTMQILIAFFTAIAIGSIYSPIEKVFGITKEVLILVGIGCTFLVLISYGSVLKNLERTLGWREEFEDVKFSLEMPFVKMGFLNRKARKRIIAAPDKREFIRYMISQGYEKGDPRIEKAFEELLEDGYSKSVEKVKKEIQKIQSQRKQKSRAHLTTIPPSPNISNSQGSGNSSG